MWDRIKSGYLAFKSVYTCQGRSINGELAGRILKSVRGLALVCWGLAIPWNAALWWSYPKAQAQALGVLEDRFWVLAETSRQVYDYGVRASVARAKGVQASNLPPVVKDYEVAKSLEMARQFADDAIAIRPVLDTADKARKSLPSRLSSSAAWADPITGIAIKEGASQAEVERIIHADLNRPNHPDYDAFLTELAFASRSAR